MTTIETPQQPAPGQQTERIEEFKREIADMRLRDPATSRDRMLLRGGVALMVIGVGFAIAGYFGSHNTTNPLSQRDYIITALIGLSLTVAGGAVFVRYSIAQFLRFWLARLSYEQQRQTDRLIDSLKR
jgi:hypothetical protein